MKTARSSDGRAELLLSRGGAAAPPYQAIIKFSTARLPGAALARTCAVAISIVMAALIVLPGCMVGPDYKRPEATDAMPAAYAGSTNIWKPAKPRDTAPKGNWWEVFGDPELNRLEAAATSENQNLKSAVAAYDQARALLDVARSGLFPHLQLAPSAIRERDSGNRPINGVSNGKPDTYTTYEVPVDLNYELDIWGRVRRIAESARATLQANAADVATIRLSIQSEVAMDYFTLHALDAEVDLLRSSVEVFQKSLDLTKNRRAGGIATDLDVSQAETILKTTEAQIPATVLQRQQTEHALAVLTGQPASSFKAAEKLLDAKPPILPAGVPSELLERRPDIASQERLMAAANANIGVAKSAFFPAIQINGAAGFESVGIGTLFQAPSRMWSIGPSLTLPLFEGGLNAANLRAARAAYNQAVANYRQYVLQAFGEVEDNLSAQYLLAQEDEAEAAAVESARKTLEIAMNRYRSGLVTYLEVATAQNAALVQERTAVRLRGNRFVTAVALVKSLGGGWDISQLSQTNGVANR